MSGGRSDLGGEDLRDLFQELPRETDPTDACPAPDALWAAARGELNAEETRRIVDHTGRCPSCAEDWRLARFVARRVPNGQTTGARTPSRAARRLRWLSAAAVVTVALLGAGALFWQRAGREPVFRVESQEAIDSIESLVPEDEPLSRTDPTLRWSGPEKAVYDLVVTTEDLKVLVEEERLEATEYRLPPSALADLDPGAVLLWHVEAIRPDGARVPSRTFRVRIELDQPSTRSRP